MADSKPIQIDAPSTLHHEKKGKALPPTNRFELKLNTDSKTHNIKNTDFAEFSYAALVEEPRFSNDEDDDQQLQEIAGSYEEKYNPKPKKEKDKKLAVSEDYIDKGTGYDEMDPFIDNEEAYDELVPSTLTTQFGGFYVNKGVLEFRNLGDIGEKDVRFKKRSKEGGKESRKNRKLGQKNKKRYGRKTLQLNDNTLVKPTKKSLPAVADVLQQQKIKLQLMQEGRLQKMQQMSKSDERELEQIQFKVEENYVDEVLVEQVTSINKSQIQGSSKIVEPIESAIKAAAEGVSLNESAGPTTRSSDAEAHMLNSRQTNNFHIVPKKREKVKPSTKKKKVSHDIASNLSNTGLNIEPLLKSKHYLRQSNQEVIETEDLPREISTLNLKQKDAIASHSQQFAVAFERTETLVSKIHNVKDLHNMHTQNSSVGSSSSLSPLNAVKHIYDYPYSTSSRGSLERPHKITLEPAKLYGSTSHGTVTPPCKKRTKYTNTSNEINEHWTRLFDASLGSSLLKGMKCDPFPVSISSNLSKPPPAHSSLLRPVSISSNLSTPTPAHSSPLRPASVSSNLSTPTPAHSSTLRPVSMPSNLSTPTPAHSSPLRPVSVSSNLSTPTPAHSSSLRPVSVSSNLSTPTPAHSSSLRPVSISSNLSTPTPAHSSSLRQTVPESQITNSHTSPGLRIIRESKPDISHHDS